MENKKFCAQSFNSNESFREKIVNLLAQNLFDGSQKIKSALLERYGEMAEKYAEDEAGKNYFLKELAENEFAFSENLKNFKNKTNLGTDIPCWIEKNDAAFCEQSFDLTLKNLAGKTVMLVGQSPKRENLENHNLYLSSPWGFHSKKYRDGKQIVSEIGGKNIENYGTNARIIAKIAGTLVKNGANVYLTDSVKLYCKENAEFCSGAKSAFSKILSEEISLVNPDFILYFKKPSDENLEILLNSRKIFCLEHPNSRNFEESKDEYYKKAILGIFARS